MGGSSRRTTTGSRSPAGARAAVERGEVDWRRISTPESIALDDRAIAEIRERGTSAPFEKEYTRPDGTRVPVLVVRSHDARRARADRVVRPGHDRPARRDRQPRPAGGRHRADVGVGRDDRPGRPHHLRQPGLRAGDGLHAATRSWAATPGSSRAGSTRPPSTRPCGRPSRAATTWRGEIVNLTKDGRRILEDASISPVRDDAGRITGYVAVKRDVTARARARRTACCSRSGWRRSASSPAASPTTSTTSSRS